MTVELTDSISQWDILLGIVILGCLAVAGWLYRRPNEWWKK